MCYHALYLFMKCGHTVTSAKPVPNAPPCPLLTKELFRRPSLASPIGPVASAGDQIFDTSVRRHNTGPQCREVLSHPLHTFRIDGFCLSCSRGREERLARFEVDAIRNDVNRSFARLRVKQQQRQRSKKQKALRVEYEGGRAANNVDEILATVVERVKDLLGWQDSSTT